MIRIILHIVFLSSFILSALSFAESDGVESDYKYKMYLACAQSGNQDMPKAEFDRLIAQPFCARDTNMNPVTIQNFEILYAERGLYQDSSGLPIIFTDYIKIPCQGNQLKQAWVDYFLERSYKGDTVYIEQVKVLGADNKSHLAEGMKIIIR